MVKMKSCTNKNCDQINPQPFGSFYTTKGKPSCWCKVCFRKNVNARNKTERVRRSETSRKWHAGNKERVKNRKLFERYGISSEKYEELLTAQSRKCAICGKDQSVLKQMLNVDHCHKTGKIRGLLCNTCNRGIGLLCDNAELCKKAFVYLETSV